jgi:hypothetical protein
MAKTPPQWCQAISRVLVDGRLRRELETSARARIERDYTWRVKMAPLVSLCEKLVSGLKRNPGGDRAALLESDRISPAGVLCQ